LVNNAAKVFELMDLVILFIDFLDAIAVGTGYSVGFRGSYSDMQPQPQRYFTPLPNAFHNQPAYQVHCEIFV